ncbi:hypothetical protein [Candidatus Odyssella acanthamoebae]|uniref:Uncharacterized protein n=1 Tax=Candidatus Odyssella acanthamoebae TaxID=91604 RepID=A0A077AUC4_9PROT|nr:hypothetical protein [Candidatus Paracaedibacter acanthamoebae]AIK95951.1 hypothetical protein ID47_03155 [Candidatus Paracaedibacter acanthamoebae]
MTAVGIARHKILLPRLIQKYEEVTQKSKTQKHALQKDLYEIKKRNLKIQFDGCINNKWLRMAVEKGNGHALLYFLQNYPSNKIKEEYMDLDAISPRKESEFLRLCKQLQNSLEILSSQDKKEALTVFIKAIDCVNDNQYIKETAEFIEKNWSGDWRSQLFLSRLYALDRYLPPQRFEREPKIFWPADFSLQDAHYI